jgi:hypothetical protein
MAALSNCREYREYVGLTGVPKKVSEMSRAWGGEAINYSRLIWENYVIKIMS